MRRTVISAHGFADDRATTSRPRSRARMDSWRALRPSGRDRAAASPERHLPGDRRSHSRDARLAPGRVVRPPGSGCRTMRRRNMSHGGLSGRAVARFGLAGHRSRLVHTPHLRPTVQPGVRNQPTHRYAAHDSAWNMLVGGRQAAMVAAVAFVIGIGLGLVWGPFASHRGGPIETPVAHRAEVDAGRPAMASSETMPPIPPDAPDAPKAGPDATPPEQQTPPPPPAHTGKRKRNPRTTPK